MRHHHPLAATAAAVGAVLALACGARAEVGDTSRPVVQIQTRDLNGAETRVPAADRPTVLLFARADQEQTARAGDGLKMALQGVPPVQTLVVFSGRDSTAESATFAKTLPWPTVMDPDYVIAGQLEISAWPTTVVVASDGRELTRLAGLGSTYVRDLNAYLSFATHAIDRAALDRRLGTTGVAADSPAQQAGRHARIAQQLLDTGSTDEAKAELDRGQKLAPQDPYLLLLSARVALLQKDPQRTLALLETVDERTVDARAIATLRGAALVALKRADEAVPILLPVLKLNPDPCEAFYFLGAAYQQSGRDAEAATAFRAAFEHSQTGRILSPALGSSTSATEPAQ
jgi:thioredoxin-like negative regulator of GroEL